MKTMENAMKTMENAMKTLTENADLPSGNLTELRKIAHVQTIYLPKIVMFHSYVKLPENSGDFMGMYIGLYWDAQEMIMGYS